MSAAQNINYEAMEATKTHGVKQDLTLKLKAQTKDAGQIDGLKRSILGFVASENYELSKDSLRAYVYGRSDFPIFKDRAERYVEHCCDLIQAIEVKRNFPGISSLTFSKQQEIHEGVMRHFEELKSALTTIQRLERELKLEDLRSTTWFLSTLSHCLFLLVSISFVIAVSAGLGQSFFMIVDHLTDKFSSGLLNLIGL
jgi:hypothetical protein